MTWQVHKFGGTSVATAERYQRVSQLVDEALKQEQKSQLAVVVSAMAKVTDALIEVTTLAEQQNQSYLEKLSALRERHHQTIRESLSESSAVRLCAVVDRDIENLKEILRGVWHLKTATQSSVELVAGHGEIWSAQILTENLRARGLGVKWLDAREVLLVESGETAVTVLWPESQLRLNGYLAREVTHEVNDTAVQVVVITGFVASNRHGVATTLKRNGSDYSASIFAALLKAKSIVIWTDVDGVLSADPRLVPEAVVLDDLSYQEATELAYFGAKVVHPSTMQPAIGQEIPIWIRNTFSPEKPGTKIHRRSTSQSPIKGFATIDHVALINVEGTGMVGVPGVAQRLFGSLRDIDVSVIMISQASSEHSICFVIPESQAEVAKKAVENTFAAEMHAGVIQMVDVTRGCSILAAVGDNMAFRPGLAGRFLSALGRSGVNIRAIAQGSSERNISVVIDSTFAVRALRSVHAAFFLSNHTLSIGVIGVGGVGGTLLAQLSDVSERLRQELKIDFRVRAIADSKKMFLADQAIDLKNWRQELGENGQGLDLSKLQRHVAADHLPHSVLVDCTSSTEITKSYIPWLRAGTHVITPNKKANTQDFAFYEALKKAVLESERYFLYETTVGAGLPIINTARELVRTGDQILAVEGVLSGTLSYIFNLLSGSTPFSAVVTQAKLNGFTEPDPRDDLSGLDVARKLVILAREIGRDIELSQVKITPILPAEFAQLSVDEFMHALAKFDADMLSRWQAAQAAGQVLRFVGRIDADGASVGLRAFGKDHAFARLAATDNIVAFTTKRYQQPLIVQGPGAGREVTAGGVFSDLLRLSSYLGAPL